MKAPNPYFGRETWPRGLSLRKCRGIELYDLSLDKNSGWDGTPLGFEASNRTRETDREGHTFEKDECASKGRRRLGVGALSPLTVLRKTICKGNASRWLRRPMRRVRWRGAQSGSGGNRAKPAGKKAADAIKPCLMISALLTFAVGVVSALYVISAAFDPDLPRTNTGNISLVTARQATGWLLALRCQIECVFGYRSCMYSDSSMCALSTHVD